MVQSQREAVPSAAPDTNNYDTNDMEVDADMDDMIFFQAVQGGTDDNQDDFRVRQMRAADRLSFRLLAVQDDEDEEDRVLRQSLRLVGAAFEDDDDDEDYGISDGGLLLVNDDDDDDDTATTTKDQWNARIRVLCMIVSAATGLALAIAGTIYTFHVVVIGPPNQPVGPYVLVELQEGDAFFDAYTFYEGPDSIGSNGYLHYLSEPHATEQGILNVTFEDDDKHEEIPTKTNSSSRSSSTSTGSMEHHHHQQHDRSDVDASSESDDDDTELWGSSEQQQQQQQQQQVPNDEQLLKPFVYMGSSPTPEGPRNSIRLEGNRRFNRGLFIIDVRHMPTGCGVWPAFWLTDEANWPLHGEIDIIESVNFLSTAKTALHSTKTCNMADIPLGTMTGDWDTAQGIPNAKTGIPDMTLRYAKDCFVYNPHQWLNQGCVAVDSDGESLGEPLNRKGGGVFALEWDPINRHIRSWVFAPHTDVPDNLRNAIQTASLEGDERVMPDPELWPIPYAYFAVGEGTDCPASHFRYMRLVFNTAFCGSVAGNRFQLDCPELAKEFATCNDWIKSDAEELSEAYWKIRGVFVYERAWEKTWLNR